MVSEPKNPNLSQSAAVAVPLCRKIHRRTTHFSTATGRPYLHLLFVQKEKKTPSVLIRRDSIQTRHLPF